jgi:CDP-diacylglycerol--serine O-phosphatidyltransferase
MNILKHLKAADLLTIGNLSSGLLSIFLSIHAHFLSAAILMLAAMVFDFLDGRVAHLLKQQNTFGKQIDSLADIVSFGVAPAVLFAALSQPGIITTAVLVFFVACGMLRLARYNVSKADGFEGVPITNNGWIFPALYFLYLEVPQTLLAWPVIYLVMGFLMISSIKIPRVV